MTTTNDPQQQPALGTCARCDQPATAAITDAPGNVRCDVHAAAIFQPYSVQQQPPPSARPNNPRMICDCGECVGDRPAPSTGATAGGEKHWHLGHVPGTVLVDKTELDSLRAEVAQLRADLAQAQAERDLWLQENDRLRLALAALDQTQSKEDAAQ